MLTLVHDFIWLVQTDEVDHDFRSWAFFYGKQCKQVIVVDLFYQSVDFDIVVQVLTASSAG